MICTVSTIKDSPQNVTRFVESNLASGADHLFVFVEGGDPEVLALLRGHPHVTAVDCDEVARRAPRPESLNIRQTINANRINCLLADAESADWLFHIDGDEVLDIDRGRLLALGPEVESVRLRTKEAVSTSRPEYEGYVKHLLERDELALLKVLDLIDRPSNRAYFHGHVLGKVGIRPSLRHGLHIHQARRLGEDGPLEGLRAGWLHVLHHESVTLEEFVRKWNVHIDAGPSTRFRGEKELIRSSIRGVLGNPHLDEETRRRYLAEIYRRRVEDDVPALLGLGMLERVEQPGHRPESFTRREQKWMGRMLPELLEADEAWFLPKRTERDPRELMPALRESVRRGGSLLAH